MRLTCLFRRTSRSTTTEQEEWNSILWAEARLDWIIVDMRDVREIRTEEEMRALLEESKTATVVLFKYSPTCGISHVAQEAWGTWTENAPAGFVLACCDVIAARGAARGISSWVRVLHQSPQVMVLRDGICIAHASHYSITEAWLRSLAA